MVRLIERLADRTLSLVAPATRAEAQACDYGPCVTEFCYCSGNRYYTRLCCRTASGSRCCYSCEYRGNYC